MPASSHRSRPAVRLVIAAVAAAAALAGCSSAAAPSGHPSGQQSGSTGPAVHLTSSAPKSGTPVCGQPILNSPYGYNGRAGTFSTSGTPAGLPTFGSAGSDFPAASRIVVIPAGDNSGAAGSGAYQRNNTIFYFEPGRHVIQRTMYAGDHSVYLGGYTAAAGKAVLDGVNGATTSGDGGNTLASAANAPGNNVGNTWEYLTVKNYTASQNNAVLGNESGGDGTDNGDVYEYDTIGPNEYGYTGQSTPPGTGESSGGGYAIDLGSNAVVKHDCLIRNAQGGFNGSNTANVVISDNEISGNGLGEYPDMSGPGGSPHACGCSGGGKLFYSLNATITGNYVHDNYNAGIWLDFDNSGAEISRNYISANWGYGIEYEASFNASISDNTLADNGWAADGTWPAGIHGKACYGGVSCTGGLGPVTGKGGGLPYSAVYLPNSGGNASLSTVKLPDCSSGCKATSRYAGHLLVQGNSFVNNFGGVMVYTDTNRYPGNVDYDSACGAPLGALDQPNSHEYYQQPKVLVTSADATVSGTKVTSRGGTKAICDNFDQTRGANGNSTSSARAPSAGMAVFNQQTGAFVGTVASVSGPTSFTLAKSGPSASAATLLLSAYGGCGPADYYGGALGKTSGKPAADYWDNCLWGSRNVTVSGNSFSLNAAKVTGCTTENLCGYMAAVAFNAGVPQLMQYWDAYTRYIANASGGLGNVWSGNSYSWSGGGPGGWQFRAGPQSTAVTAAQWKAAPYHQDAGSNLP